MNIILYTNGKEMKAGERLLNKICSKFSCEHIEIIDNLDDFRKRIYSFPKNIDVAVILATNSSQLSDIIQYSDVLDEIEIILILPDQNKDTVSMGLTLYPRFLAYMDSDFDDVKAVLEKLSSRYSGDCSKISHHVANNI